jgi:hypothetical protein
MAIILLYIPFFRKKDAIDVDELSEYTELVAKILDEQPSKLTVFVNLEDVKLAHKVIVSKFILCSKYVADPGPEFLRGPSTRETPAVTMTNRLGVVMRLVSLVLVFYFSIFYTIIRMLARMLSTMNLVVFGEFWRRSTKIQAITDTHMSAMMVTKFHLHLECCLSGPEQWYAVLLFIYFWFRSGYK